MTSTISRASCHDPLDTEKSLKEEGKTTVYVKKVRLQTLNAVFLSTAPKSGIGGYSIELER